MKIFLAGLSTCYSQQFWENEFHSNEEQMYKKVLKTGKVKKIVTFYHYKKGAAAIPDKVYELDKNGNILTVIKKADQEIKYDVVIERNGYDKKENLISHIEFSGLDTSKFVSYQYDSLNNITLEIRKETSYRMGKNDQLEKMYNGWTYRYENTYNSAHLLSGQLKTHNSDIVLKAAFSYDASGHLIEIKRFYKESPCLESWVQFSYDPDGFLKSKFYPNYECKGGKATLNSNRYTYTYNAQKRFAELERTNSGQARGKILYTYSTTDF
jgi:hypothetical protein